MKNIFKFAILIGIVAVAFARKKRLRTPQARTNDRICQRILDSWWYVREFDDNRLQASEWDNVCSIFNGHKDACMDRSIEARSQFISSSLVTTEQATAVACTMVGANSDKCIGNPCNHLNNGDCTLQKTGGLCVWHTKRDRERFGVPFGCHRNPCHMGGSGRVSDSECESQSIPGYIQCTYCSAQRDPELVGVGMGCQRADKLHTTAECAKIESGIPPDETVFEQIKKPLCQCTTNSFLCKTAVESRSGGYKPKYGAGDS